MVLHLQHISTQGDACNFRNPHVQPPGGRGADQCTRRSGLARAHAGTHQQNQWGQLIQGLTGLNRTRCDVGRTALSTSEFRELKHTAQHLYSTGLTHIGIVGGTASNDPTQVEQVQDVPGPNSLGDFSGKATEGFSLAQDARHRHLGARSSCDHEHLRSGCTLSFRPAPAPPPPNRVSQGSDHPAPPGTEGPRWPYSRQFYQDKYAFL